MLTTANELSRNVAITPLIFDLGPVIAVLILNQAISDYIGTDLQASYHSAVRSCTHA